MKVHKNILFVLKSKLLC